MSLVSVPHTNGAVAPTGLNTDAAAGGVEALYRASRASPDVSASPPAALTPLPANASDVMPDEATARICGWAPALLATQPHGRPARDVLVAFRVLQRYAVPDAAACYAGMCAVLETAPVAAVLACCHANAALAAAAARSVDTAAVAGVELRGSDVEAACADDERRRVAVSLDLTPCYLGIRGVLAVLVTLPTLHALETLIWRQSLLDSNAVVLLAQVATAARMPALRRIDVSHNPFGSVGAQSLVELAAVRNPNLVGVGVDGVEMLAGLHRRLADVLVRNRMRLETQPGACQLQSGESTPVALKA